MSSFVISENKIVQNKLFLTEWIDKKSTLDSKLTLNEPRGGFGIGYVTFENFKLI